MPLVNLLTSLKTPNEIFEWSFAHARDHDEIDEALAALGVTTVKFPLDPFPPLEATEIWQEFHQQKHLVIDQALGLINQGLTGFDFVKPEDRVNFANINFQSHQLERAALKI